MSWLIALLIGVAHAQVGQIGPPTLFVPFTTGSVCSSFVTDYSVPCNLIVATTTGLGL